MRRSRVFLILAGLIFAAVGAGWTVIKMTTEPGIPTMRLHPQAFSLRVTAEGNLEAVENTPLGVPISGGRPLKISWMIEDGSRVSRDDVVVRFDATDFEETLKEGRADLKIVTYKLEKAQTELEATIRDLELDVTLAREEAGNARSFKNTDENIYSRNQIIESEIDTVLAEKKATHAEAARKVAEQLARAGIELLEIERGKVELNITKAEEGLKSLQLSAPRDGIVTFRRDWRGNIPHVGEQFWPGRPLASMPVMEEMQAVVYILEADAGGLGSEQRAEVSLEAHPEHSFSAKVLNVDPVAQRKTRGVPVQYFRTILKLDKSDTKLMKPGGRVHAEIFISEEKEALVLPRQAVFKRDGKATVFRREDDGFKPVPVETGASSGGRVLVLSGLSAGDVIALRDPEKRAESPTPTHGDPGIGAPQ